MMNNFDTKALKQVLRDFELLDEENKKKAISEIGHDWFTAVGEFADIISKHPEIAKKIRALRIVQAKRAPIEGDYFEKVYGIDPITDEPDYVYDEDLHKESQKLYENWDAITAEFQKKLNRLETGAFVPNRQKRIETLKRKFKDMSAKAENYKLFLEDTRVYDSYRSNPERIADLRHTLQEQVGSLSHKFLQDKLQSQPQLICYQPSAMPEYWERHPQYVCAEMKSTLLKEIEQEHTSSKPTQEKE